MSDYNVIIQEVDSAMDMIESYSKEANDIRAHILFDMSSLFDLVDRNIIECQREIDRCSDNTEDNNDSRRLYILLKRLDRLSAIRETCEGLGQELVDELKQLFICADTLSNDAVQEMGRYISKLNLVSGMPEDCSSLSISHGQSRPTYVCVIDSARYPQTAEHIRIAQNMGFPSVLTLDRENAADRRKASLEHIATSQIYDRDEYPCAVFSEEGSGADVVYVDGSDNRGAGAYMRWQMQGMPDGAQIRIRVI